MTNRTSCPFTDLGIAAVAGAAIMVLEITAARVLAPHVGTSLPVWTSIIGIMLAGLGLGSLLGGALAHYVAQRRRFLSLLFFLTGLWILLLPLSDLLLLAFVRRLHLDLRVVALGATIVLFLLPSVGFGGTLPLLLGGTTSHKESAPHQSLSVGLAAQSAGHLSAASTFGSLAGTFLAGFFLFSWLSTNQVLIAIGITTLGTSLIISLTTPRILVAVTVSTLAIISLSIRSQYLEAVGYRDVDTPYTRGFLIDTPSQERSNALRSLVVDPFGAQAIVAIDEPDKVIVDYIRFYRIIEGYTPEPSSLLILGAGGFTLARDMLDRFPTATIVAVEIDPGMTKVSKEHLFLPHQHPRLTIIHEGARVFLSRLTAPETVIKFDAVLIDLFGPSGSPPFHLFSVEAFRLMRSVISDNGILVMNTLARTNSSARSPFVRAAWWGLHQSFETVEAYPLRSSGPLQNVMVTATPLKTTSKGTAVPMLSPENALAPPLLFTDSYSPVEYHLHRLLFGKSL